MAEVKLKNLLRLSRPRNKFDAVILAVHSCLAEKGFRCINSGEEVRYLRCNWNGNRIHLGTLILCVPEPQATTSHLVLSPNMRSRPT